MAVTDTLVAIKEYFFAWHENYYEQIHKKILNQISDQPDDDNKLVTNKGIREYIQNIIAPIHNKIGSNTINAFNKTNLTDAVNHIAGLWQSVSISRNGYMTSSQYMTYERRTRAFSYSFKTRGGWVKFYRVGGMLGICNIRGCKIPKGLSTNKTYVLFGIPPSRSGTETSYTTLDTSSDVSAFWKPTGPFLGSSSYDEVKWINVLHFDSYNADSSPIYKTDGTKLTTSGAKSSYPRGAVTFKPLDSDHERYVYATIVYRTDRFPTETDIRKEIG